MVIDFRSMETTSMCVCILSQWLTSLYKKISNYVSKAISPIDLEDICKWAKTLTTKCFFFVLLIYFLKKSSPPTLFIRCVEDIISSIIVILDKTLSSLSAGTGDNGTNFTLTLGGNRLGVNSETSGGVEENTWG